MTSSASTAALVEWHRRVQRAEATSLAREGKLALAESIISGIEEMAQSTACLDLLARIRAQQGRLDEARTLWLAASQAEPGEHIWGHLAERATFWQTRRFGRDRLPLYVAVLTTVVLTVGGWVVVHRIAPHTVITSDGGGASPGAEGGRTAALNDSRPTATAAGSIPARGEPPWPPALLGVRLPGVSVRRDGGAALVVFDGGLFLSGTRMTVAGRRTLKELARQLKDKSDGVMFTIIGHTDDVRPSAKAPFRDNITLGLARAADVAEYLRGVAELEASSLVIQSLGPEGAPFSQGSLEGRVQNRTVVIRLESRSRSTEPPP